MHLFTIVYAHFHKIYESIVLSLKALVTLLLMHDALGSQIVILCFAGMKILRYI